MVTQSSSNANVDQIGNTFYNGIPTIEKKVELAHKKVGGIMIWELAQDSFTEYSLLNAIHEKYTELDVTTTGLGSNSVTLSSEDFDLSSNIKLYPNPVNNVLNFSQNLTDIVHSFELYDLTGRKIVTANIENKSQIDVSSLSKGLYSIIFKTKKGSITKRIMKQ
ncbi:T9SS type A sorting domain-containing protein [Polaribacter sp. R77954]|uniref:T9SS type A sorting domain-containing protein n=1 Tax=Polaribacter sp. R77954 TaxID=3093870 RepID=UPI0037C94E8B